MRSEALFEVASVLMSSSSSRMLPLLSESSWRMRSCHVVAKGGWDGWAVGVASGFSVEIQLISKEIKGKNEWEAVLHSQMFRGQGRRGPYPTSEQPGIGQLDKKRAEDLCKVKFQII